MPLRYRARQDEKLRLAVLEHDGKNWKVIAQSGNEDVVATSLLAVTRLNDYQSMDQILMKLDDPSTTVRSTAATSVAKLLGRDHHFPVRGSKAERTRVKNQIVKDWKQYNGSELFEFNKNRFN